VQQRDRVAEARLEAPDGLRRQGDLRDEHDHALAARERRRRRAQVDLGLARSGDAVQQVRATGLDGRERGGLLRGQLDHAVGRRPRQRLAALSLRLEQDEATGLEPAQRAEVSARGRRQAREQRALALAQPLAVEARLRAVGPQARARAPGRRQHERERARGRRGVLGGHPERQLDEVGRHGVRAHGARRDQPLGRQLALGREPDHHAVEALAAERDPHDGADLERLRRQRVVERPGQPAGGGEGLDPGDHAWFIPEVRSPLDGRWRRLARTQEGRCAPGT
jgi:hypothetical protein